MNACPVSFQVFVQAFQVRFQGLFLVVPLEPGQHLVQYAQSLSSFCRRCDDISHSFGRGSHQNWLFLR